jgi:2-C-methyl-D-erythritol 4-phosphate cytidylyltransferase/2-C-methyl-D-erythritol 2,4-cyclodiphosphate synthase
MASPLPFVAVLVAAGRGTRVGGDVPKQFRKLAGRPVYAHALGAFLAHPMIGRIVLVAPAADVGRITDDIGETARPVTVVAGGATRQASVAAALAALPAGLADDTLVLIHDAARPLVSADLITAGIAAGLAHGAAVPGTSLTDTVKLVAGDGRITGTPERASLRAVQTPQVFRLDLIRRAHAAATGRDNPDDAALVEALGHPVTVFEGDPGNLKLTVEADFSVAEQRLTGGPGSVRTGVGFDVHRYRPGDHVMLGGVRIAHDRGLDGHSDADVVLHALTDAILGCLADGDIGQHFSPKDARWRGAASSLFLADAVRRLANRGGRVLHLDVMVLAEAPRIGPHREAMRQRIAEIAGIAPGRVGIKATTMEAMGFVGRGEGAAALATATLSLPGDD